MYISHTNYKSQMVYACEQYGVVFCMIKLMLARWCESALIVVAGSPGLCPTLYSVIQCVKY